MISAKPQVTGVYATHHKGVRLGVVALVSSQSFSCKVQKKKVKKGEILSGVGFEPTHSIEYQSLNLTP